jgi:hypothetical protein
MNAAGGAGTWRANKHEQPADAQAQHALADLAPEPWLLPVDTVFTTLVSNRVSRSPELWLKK